MTINFNDLSNITFDGTVYNEVTKASDNTSAVTQEKSNVTYDNFLLHSSKEWLSTIQNVSSELVKEAKETSAKVKADNKVVDATKKSAPDSNAFKDSANKVSEGVKDLSANVAAMTEVTNYGGAINFISTTAVNTLTGSITNISDMGTFNKSPSITNTSNVVVNNAATAINYSDTVFSKTDRDITVTNQQLLSATDKHNLVTNTTSTTSKSNKTAATEDHQVVSSDQKQYSNTHTTLTNNTTLIGSKGDTSVITQGGLVIGAGQTNKTVPSQASTDGAEGVSTTAGSIKIVSTGDINTISTGTISNQGDSFGANANKIGLSSTDFASNSTTSTILSKTQTVVSSDGITYTGNRNVGIAINPFGILAGSGIAPFIPFLSEQLPPIVIDIPELPEFPFGDLSDFLSKCLPFASPIDLTNVASEGGGSGDVGGMLDGPTGILAEGPSNPLPEGPEPLLISLEDPLVIQDKGAIDNPIKPEESSAANEPKNAKGVKSVPKNRDVTTSPNAKTDPKEKPVPFTARQAVSSAAKLGILHKVFIDPPEGPVDKTTTTTTTSDVPEITFSNSVPDSIKSLSGLQQAEVVNSFNINQRPFINNNYSDFINSVAIVDVYGKGLDNEITTNANKYNKNVLEILNNNNYVQQIQTFLNTKRPNGIGGQQPPNIQDDISNPISDLNTGGRTPPTPGQGIIDVLTSLNTANQSPSLFSTTTENWFTPENLDNMTFSFGDELNSNNNLSGISELLNNQYANIIKQAIPDAQIQSALSLTQDIVAGRITTPEQYATRLAALVGGDINGYISYAQQALNIYQQVQQGNYSSLLNIPGINNVLGSQGTAIATKILDLASKKNITDQDIYSVAGSIFTSLTGIGIPLLDELAKLLGCIDSLKQQDPTLQDIPNSDLQDIIDYLPRVIQTVDPLNRSRVLNITPSNCGQISLLSAEEATINLTEIGANYIKFELANKDLIKFNNKPMPDIETPVNLYCEFFTDRITNKVITPYKLTSQFTSNVIEYKIIDKTYNTYTAIINNPNIVLVLEDAINGSLYQYTSNDIGSRLIPYVLDSYILL